LVQSWKWFWVWMALGAATNIVLSALGFTFGIYGWIAAAIVAIVLAPLMIRIEYKITGRDWRRAKKS
jgi:hypothetical protein